MSNACVLLSMSAVMVHVSHAHKNMGMTRERIILILELMAMFSVATGVFDFKRVKVTCCGLLSYV